MKELKNERMKAKGGEQGAGGMGREEGGVGRSEKVLFIGVANLEPITNN